MKSLLVFLLLIASFGLQAAPCPEALDHNRKPLASDAEVNLCEQYLGKVVLIVNTASKCGFTNQYDGLEALYRKYKDQGLVVLGFPSNDFSNQEPGTEKQIQEFCRSTFGVKFPMFAKTNVARGTQDPLYQTLALQAGEYPQWNFHKYLLDRHGKVVKSFPSRLEPGDTKVIKSIEGLLAQR